MSLFNISLSITRRSLYIVVITLAVTILLPWSVLSYLRFYGILIPNASYELPVRMSSPRYNSEIVAEGSSLVDILANYNVGTGRVSNLNYNLELEIAAHCNKHQIGDTQIVVGELIMGNQTCDLPSEYRRSSFGSSSFILQCDPRVIYSSSNWFIPYNFRHWVPPFLTNCERLNVINVKIGTFSDIEMLNLLTNTATNNATDPARIRYWTDSKLQIDVTKSKLHVNVEWQGIRYYLFYHYYICFALGVGMFWAVSSSVCLVVSMAVWWGVRSKVKSD
ncbi:hypothetical protein CLIB1423_13S03818 [[Candida] railenensis]|uniref:Seipin n=1 Tax=[Candida] railenensis TaxID=45579 RepID=A0A9P0QTD3_9ASCO|nr:hypothetical protein CLIB1423_13S03818 [[Candida] railenensis]